MIEQQQPLHVVYGGAHLFHAGTVPKLGQLAATHLMAFASDCFEFAEAVGLPEAQQVPTGRSARKSLMGRLSRSGVKARHAHPDAWIVYAVHTRVLEKLHRQAVEDYRIDFEDGYGARSNEEEDGHAVQAAEQTVGAMANRALPPHFGIRIKPLSSSSGERAIRTLELYLTRLLTRTAGILPTNFVVTLPKIHGPREVVTLSRWLQDLEQRAGLRSGLVKMELMIETPEVLSNAEGRCLIRELVSACEGRCRGLHLGLYDFLSSLDVVSSAQSYLHPLADHLRSVTKVSVGGDQLWLSDGATNRIPVGPHRNRKLKATQRAENRAEVHQGWHEVFRHVDHSLRMGYYQGWDLHPSQFAPRYAAIFALFVREEPAAAGRLKAFLDTAAQATLRGQQFDDAATAQGLLNFFQRGIACGALPESSLISAGLTRQELHRRSFAEIVGARRNGA